MEIKTRELTKPAINQIQKPNFKNQQLKVRHTFTHTHTHTHNNNLVPTIISLGAPGDPMKK